MNGEIFIKLKSFFPFSDPFFYIFGRFFKTECRTFLRMVLLQFLISYFLILIYYTLLFIAIEFIFAVSLKHIICLPKKPQWLFFSWLDYKSLLSKLSVLINYSVLGGLPIIFLHPAVSHVFHVQVQGLGPGFRSSPLITVPLLYEYISWSHVHFHPGVKLNDDT